MKASRCLASSLALSVLFAVPALAEFEFFCTFDESPLSVGADPTLFSTTRMTDPELSNPFFGVSITLSNTATSGSTTVGPQTITRPKSDVPPSSPVWRINNTFAFPPFTATWALSSRMTRTDVIFIGTMFLPVPIQDLCTAQALVSPGAGGGGGGCMIVDPANSILTLSGEVEALPKALHRQPLTQKRLAENGREIVTDQYSVVGGNSPVADSLSITSSRPASLLIRHQRMHPANHNFAPTPHVTFTPQLYADPSAQGQRGFAVIDFGESGRVLNVRVLPGDSGVAPRVLASAIADAVHTEFEDHRRHDHRAYLAYRIEGRTLHLEGEPIVTMPLCCGPPIGCPPPPYHCY